MVVGLNIIKEDMKPLNLSKEHKVKLLEMCVKLFPKYKGWKFGSNKIAADYELWFYDEDDNNFEIHWFEFCVSYLIPKFTDDIQDLIDLRILFCELQNPVDYLYQAYKKYLNETI